MNEPETNHIPDDPELQAMIAIDRALSELDRNAALRVVGWVISRLTPSLWREFSELAGDIILELESNR